MAIGDGVAQIIGTATTNRQPASGVEEEISSLLKPGVTDAPAMYDGSSSVVIYVAAVRTDIANVTGANVGRHSTFNIALKLTNAVYFRKPGTTDIMYLGGVQTNV